jgi:hypothetical protein
VSGEVFGCLARATLERRAGYSVRSIAIPIASRHGIVRLHDALGVAPTRLAALARDAGD